MFLIEIIILTFIGPPHQTDQLVHSIWLILGHIDLLAVLRDGQVMRIRVVCVARKHRRHIATVHIEDETLHLHSHVFVQWRSIHHKQLAAVYGRIRHAEQSVADQRTMVLRMKRSVAVLETLNATIFPVREAEQPLVQGQRQSVRNR